MPELHLGIELIERITHPLVFGSLEFLNGDGLRHIIVYQTSPDVIAEFLHDDVDGDG